MAIIGIGVGVPFRRNNDRWSSYWATLLSDIGYNHPMLPGLTINKVAGVWTITSHTINDFRKTLASPRIKYLDCTNGLDTNNGNTAGAAYKTLTKLYSERLNFDRAYIAAGNYATTTANLFGYDTEFIGTGGKAYICRGEFGAEKAWTDVGGGVFSTPATASPQTVVDTRNLNTDDTPIALKKVASLAAVQATADTWWWDDPNDLLYVRLYDDATPNNINVSIVSSGTIVQIGFQVYLENIGVLGGLGAATNNTAAVTEIAMKDCFTIHQYFTDISPLNGNVQAWLENVLCAYGKYDGLNYEASGAYNPSVVEVGCIAKECGRAIYYGAGAGNNNTSTGHNASIILRLNGEYSTSEGPCVHDVGDTISLNIGCTSKDSVSLDNGTKTCFAVGNGAGGGDTAKVYLYDCITSGDCTGVENRDVATAHIYAHGGSIHSVEAGTTLETF